MAMSKYLSVDKVVGEQFLLRMATTVEVMMQGLIEQGFRYQCLPTGSDSPYRFINGVHKGDIELFDEWTVAGGVVAFRDERDAVLAQLIISG